MIFAKSARTYFSVSKSGLTCKYYNRQERLARNKCSSLFGLIIIDKEKGFLNIARSTQICAGYLKGGVDACQVLIDVSSRKKYSPVGEIKLFVTVFFGVS